MSTMRRIFSIFLTWLCILGTNSLLVAGPVRLVIIDPGHGGEDEGGFYGKVYEKHLALDTAFRLEKLLQRKGFKTLLTRRSDQFISLAKRTEMSRLYRDAIFVSIHYNDCSNRNVRGVETFYHDQRSKPLAGLIQRASVRAVGAPDRAAKTGNYYVLREGKTNPSALIEGGFLSNPFEREQIKKGTYRQALASGIALGIEQYCILRKRGRLP